MSDVGSTDEGRDRGDESPRETPVAAPPRTLAPAPTPAAAPAPSHAPTGGSRRYVPPPPSDTPGDDCRPVLPTDEWRVFAERMLHVSKDIFIRIVKFV